METALIEDGVLNRIIGPNNWSISTHLHQTGSRIPETSRFNGQYRHLDPGLLVTLIEKIEQAHIQGLTAILVFVSRVDQARVYSTILNARENHISASIVHGDMSMASRTFVINGFRNGETQVLFNVDVLREGFDAPNIDCVVLAHTENIDTESRSYAQRIGRGRRGPASGGTETCTVIHVTNYDDG